MSTPPTEGRLGHLVPLRLSDLPQRVRDYGVNEYLREVDRALARGPVIDGFGMFADTMKVKLAAGRPSGRVYWISEQAYSKVVRRFRL